MWHYLRSRRGRPPYNQSPNCSRGSGRAPADKLSLKLVDILTFLPISILFWQFKPVVGEKFGWINSEVIYLLTLTLFLNPSCCHFNQSFCVTKALLSKKLCQMCAIKLSHISFGQQSTYLSLQSWNIVSLQLHWAETGPGVHELFHIHV